MSKPTTMSKMTTMKKINGTALAALSILNVLGVPVTQAAEGAGSPAPAPKNQPASPPKKAASNSPRELVVKAPAKIRAASDGLALTPPMGWYPWSAFQEAPQNEKLIKEIADALISSGMKDAGYTYMGPDEGLTFSRDSWGKLTPNLERYPSGLRGLGDHIHQLGLKYALYTDAGYKTCTGNMPGTLGFEMVDMASFADWRADYVKIDWCNTEKGQSAQKTYTLLGEAQLAAGRPIVHSVCSWGVGNPWDWAAGVSHLWRTTKDIHYPDRNKGKVDMRNVMRIIASTEKLHAAAGPGHWNDPDMLVVGLKGMTDALNRSMFSVWCMMASPLIAGNDLRKMTPEEIKVLTNKEAIGINQDPLGIQGRIVRKEGGETIVGGGKYDHAVAIWAGKPLFDGSQALLIHNLSGSESSVSVKTAEVGMEGQETLFVRDLWEHKTEKLAIDSSGSFSVTVKPGDVRFLRVSKSEEFPLPPVIVADTYRLSLRAPGELSGTITLTNKGTSELPAWKVRPDLPEWLKVEVKKDGLSQKIVNTVTATGLKKGAYHAVVRLDNTEPISGKPMSAVYYDVDLEVVEPQ